MDYIIGNVESATAIGILDNLQLLNDEGKKETVAILEYVNHKNSTPRSCKVRVLFFIT